MKKVFSIVGIIVGLAIIFAGFSVKSGFDMRYSGKYSKSYTFGADFYTEQYSATANAANNIDELGDFTEYAMEYMANAMGIMLISFGGAVTCYFGCKLGEIESLIPANTEKKEEENSVPENAGEQAEA